MGHDQGEKETSYKNSIKSAGVKGVSQADLESNKQLIEMNKRSNIVFGSSNTANFKPSEAMQAYTKPDLEQNAGNRQEAIQMKQNFKKDNFTLSEIQGNKYYDTSATNNAI